ncbi:Hypothetical_protein [Hexamita inflata]|uniref:Hypothetical_protein n=1 Tax=Hexamita inflata TaxID=28002 RepID=A0AA86N408_9EUKA|nr:Hypothetical protein HINF_LOCUS237 [Hexamita inflata]
MQTLKEVKHLEEGKFIFTVYKQNFDLRKQFLSIFQEADKTKPGGDDVILHHYTKAQRHRRLQIMTQAAKYYLQNRQKYFTTKSERENFDIIYVRFRGTCTHKFIISKKHKLSTLVVCQISFCAPSPNAQISYQNVQNHVKMRVNIFKKDTNNQTCLMDCFNGINEFFNVITQLIHGLKIQKLQYQFNFKGIFCKLFQNN